MRYFIVGLFLLHHLLAAKPIIDLRDSNMTSQHKMVYERPDFLLVTQGKYSDMMILSDFWLNRVDECRHVGYKVVIAYLMEPRVIHPFIYEYIDQNVDKFDLVMTFDAALLEKYPEKCRFVHAVCGGDLFDHKIHPKTKMCSIMTGKNYTEGHKLRHLAYETYRDYFDGYKGYDTTWARWRDPWINDYRFSVAIENSKQSHYFSEKIVQLFRAGTVPIYWGCPTIGQFFDMDGIIVFDTLEELGEILKNLSVEDYEKRRAAILHNFELAEKYPQNNLIEYPDRADALDVIWPYIKHYFENGSR
ncbi:MAG: Chrysochromulina ericina virus [Chlamydiota bacterium]|jgi:hypothetical protein